MFICPPSKNPDYDLGTVRRHHLKTLPQNPRLYVSVCVCVCVCDDERQKNDIPNRFERRHPPRGIGRRDKNYARRYSRAGRCRRVSRATAFPPPVITGFLRDRRHDNVICHLLFIMLVPFAYVWSRRRRRRRRHVRGARPASYRSPRARRRPTAAIFLPAPVSRSVR